MCVRSWECLNSSCAACLCTGMCSSPKPTDNLTWFPAESRAVLRAGCLLCLFCGFGYFFFSPCWLPAICSSRNVVAFQSQFQRTDLPAPAPSKPLPGREAAGSSPTLQCCFSSSRCCSACCGWAGRDADPGRAKAMCVGKRQWCFSGALRRFCGAEISSLWRRENLGAAALEEQDFLKGVKEFEEWVQQLWEGELIPFANYWEKEEEGETWKNMESIGNCSESRKYMEFWSHIFNCLLEA